MIIEYNQLKQLVYNVIYPIETFFPVKPWYEFFLF